MHVPASPAAGIPVADARRLAVALLLGALALAAWTALAWWSASPYARYLGHAGWTGAPFVDALCRALPQGDVVVPALLHALAWLLMIAAMMVPTTYPLLAVIVRMAAGRRDAAMLVLLTIAGYALAWAGFGLVAHAADAGLHALAARGGWLALHGDTVGAAVLAGAGVFEFSSWKYRCLDACRTPRGFVMSRWRGRRAKSDALAIGVAHGLFCIGCCFALMLVMFVVGTASLGWMLALGVAMAAEKNLPGGTRLSAPLGVALLAGALALVV